MKHFRGPIHCNTQSKAHKFRKLLCQKETVQKTLFPLSLLDSAISVGFQNCPCTCLSTGGIDAAMVERWTNYYDIFLRNAFGNFRDILKEVTWNPVMGDWLTYRGNKAFDHNSNYPDENYAREVMQLFTIGLFELNEDGTPNARNPATMFRRY